MSAQVFLALADSQRQEILLRLVHGGPQTTLVLLDGIGATRQGASRHLTVLENAGLVKSVRRGREVIREFDPTALESARTWFNALESAWDDRLLRLSGQYSDQESET